MCAQMLSSFWLFASSWTIAHQAPLSLGFWQQEYWSGVPLPPPGDLPNPGIQPVSPTYPALAGRFFTTSATWEAQPGSYLPLELGFPGLQNSVWMALDLLPEPPVVLWRVNYGRNMKTAWTSRLEMCHVCESPCRFRVGGRKRMGEYESACLRPDNPNEELRGGIKIENWI